MNVVALTGTIFVASRGPGTLTISGSAIVNCNVVDVSRSINSNIAGTVNLNGGTLVVTTRISTATNAQGAATTGSTGTFNFNGGTLKAGGNNTTDFITHRASSPNVPLSLIVKSGGAIIDSNGFSINSLESFQHDASLGATLDGGLTKNGTGTLTLSATIFVGYERPMRSRVRRRLMPSAS